MNHLHASRFLSLLGLCVLFSACALEEPEDIDGGPGGRIGEGEYLIDASSNEDWAFFDLDAGELSDASGGWDLAFRRTWIVANSEKGVQTARLEGANLEQLEAAPESGYALDRDLDSLEDDRGGDGVGFAFHDGDHWWDYDMASHSISPKDDRIYVVLSTEGRAFAIQITGYYDDAGTPGFIKLRTKEITPPVDPEEPKEPKEPEEPGDTDPGTYEEVTIDASAEDAWVFFDLDSGKVTEEASDWDLAFRRSWIVSNGPEGVGVFVLDETTLGEVQKAPAQAYETDDFEDLDALGEEELGEFVFHGESAWFRYDMDTHSLEARERVYVVVTTEGTPFAIQMMSYYDDEGTSGFPTFRYKEIEQ